MLEITVNIPGLEGLVEALKGLAGPHVMQDIKIGSAAQPVQAPPAAPIQAPPVQPPVQQGLPMAPPVSQPTQQPIQQQPAPPVGLPTTDVNYTFDQLAVGLTQIMDMGKREVVMAMLNRFGVPSLTQLSKDQYGAFANELRVLGANL